MVISTLISRCCATRKIAVAAAAFVGCTVLVVGVVATGQAQVIGQPAEGELLSLQTLAARANQKLRLTASTVQELEIAAVPAQAPLQAMNVPLMIDDQPRTLALSPHSLRAGGYKLQAQVQDGSLVDVDPGPDRMLRGTLVEAPGSMAAGGLMHDGLYMGIRMADGSTRWIEPLFGRVEGAQPNHYVVYRGEDVIPAEGSCGVDEAFLRQHPPLAMPVANFKNGGGGDGGEDGTWVRCTELAADADVEYYVRYGSNITNVQNRINLVINAVNLQYINEVDIQFVITQIIVRTAEPDPYSSTNASTLLNQFTNHWNSNHASVPRDVAHLFTGKNMDGSTIGIAWLGVVCSSNMGYSVVESDCCGTMASTTDLSAHELGHNWNAAHCTCSNPAYTMNPSITAANRHAAVSISQIEGYRNAVGCLSACADATLPFTETFPSTTFDSTKWTTVQGAIIDTVGINEPSAPNSMRLRGNSTTGGNQVRTSRINTAGLAILELKYYYERRGGGDQPETGDDLVVEYFNTSGNWVECSRQPGNGPAMTNYVLATVQLPADAKHSEFRARFRVTSTQTNLDDWFVDDITISGIAVPTNDNCVDAPLKGAGSHAFTSLGASTDGPDEPGSCTVGGYSQIGNDVWFKYLAQCTGTATISLCGANYNTKLAVYSGCPSGSGQTIACNDDSCGTASSVTFPTVTNTVYRVRIGGFNGQTGSGTMLISCTPGAPTCPADVTGDQQVNVNDLLSVINAWGPCGNPCPADCAPPGGDGQVNVNDLLAVINGWGTCP